MKKAQALALKVHEVMAEATAHNEWDILVNLSSALLLSVKNHSDDEAVDKFAKEVLKSLKMKREWLKETGKTYEDL